MLGQRAAAVLQGPCPQQYTYIYIYIYIYVHIYLRICIIHMCVYMYICLFHMQVAITGVVISKAAVRTELIADFQGNS